MTRVGRPGVLVLPIAFTSAVIACSAKEKPLDESERKSLAGTIYFVSERHGHDHPAAYRIAPDGSDEARMLGEGATDPNASTYPYSASPDGKSITIVESSEADGDKLLVARADGTQPKRIAESEGALNWYPAFSPDGSRVLFESSRDAFRELYVAEVATGSVARLTNNREGNFDASWSPDGKQIAFASSRHGHLDLFVMNADGSQQKRITDHAGDSIKPQWAPKRCSRANELIAFISARDGRDDVLLVDPATGVEKSAENLTRATERGEQVETFAWRPDGCAIAFAARTKENKSKLRVVELASRQVKELSRENDNDLNPAWSPDGRYLAFASSDNQKSDLYIMRADGERRTRLTHDPESAWLPRWLAVSTGKNP